MDFKNFQMSDQNPRVIAFGFTKKWQFTAKTNRNYVFLGREVYIKDQLYIMVHYTSFSRF
jgi:hypothetical protein